ncbi:hypothetical protein M011DRAFT_507391 [Sporormia fimetaria CBS 119925]|uniref:Uncharacterized protein n=1 Tax=Sporormia fimetaria CBS 119925 TaxID=1340428 RepID=A0A6A6VP50_9PLEO|nr:hypothetical protein M011DRAFT_507391 [Sporormia fimetaria CBS 119925]
MSYFHSKAYSHSGHEPFALMQEFEGMIDYLEKLEIAIADAKKSCLELCTKMRASLPRELRDQIYGYLIDGDFLAFNNQIPYDCWLPLSSSRRIYLPRRKANSRSTMNLDEHYFGKPIASEVVIWCFDYVKIEPRLREYPALNEWLGGKDHEGLVDKFCRHLTPGTTVTFHARSVHPFDFSQFFMSQGMKQAMLERYICDPNVLRKLEMFTMRGYNIRLEATFDDGMDSKFELVLKKCSPVTEDDIRGKAKPWTGSRAIEEARRLVLELLVATVSLPDNEPVTIFVPIYPRVVMCARPVHKAALRSYETGCPSHPSFPPTTQLRPSRGLYRQPRVHMTNCRIDMDGSERRGLEDAHEEEALENDNAVGRSICAKMLSEFPLEIRDEVYRHLVPHLEDSVDNDRERVIEWMTQ